MNALRRSSAAATHPCYHASHDYGHDWLRPLSAPFNHAEAQIIVTHRKFSPLLPWTGSAIYLRTERTEPRQNPI